MHLDSNNVNKMNSDNKSKKSKKLAQEIVDKIVVPEIAKASLRESVHASVLFQSYPNNVLSRVERILSDNGHEVHVRECPGSKGDIVKMMVVSVEEAERETMGSMSAEPAKPQKKKRAKSKSRKKKK